MKRLPGVFEAKKKTEAFTTALPSHSVQNISALEVSLQNFRPGRLTKRQNFFWKPPLP